MHYVFFDVLSQIYQALYASKILQANMNLGTQCLISEQNRYLNKLYIIVIYFITIFKVAFYYYCFR